MKFTDSKQRASESLTSKQLLAISQEISRTFSYQISSNISELVILPVDPYHLYAYWHFDDQQSIDVNTGSQKLLLKVYWQNDQDRKQDPSKLWFNVNLDSKQSQQKIRLPVDASHYSATIGTFDENQCWHILARSNTIHIPAVSMQPKIQNMEAIQTNDDNPLIVIKNTKSAEKTTNPAYNEAVTDIKIKQIVIKQDCQNNADDPLQSRAFTADCENTIHSENEYDETLIDTLIQESLRKRALTRQLVHKSFCLESHNAASVFSRRLFKNSSRSEGKRF